MFASDEHERCYEAQNGARAPALRTVHRLQPRHSRWIGVRGCASGSSAADHQPVVGVRVFSGRRSPVVSRSTVASRGWPGGAGGVAPGGDPVPQAPVTREPTASAGVRTLLGVARFSPIEHISPDPRHQGADRTARPSGIESARRRSGSLPSVLSLAPDSTSP